MSVRVHVCMCVCVVQINTSNVNRCASDLRSSLINPFHQGESGEKSHDYHAIRNSLFFPPLALFEQINNPSAERMLENVSDCNILC